MAPTLRHPAIRQCRKCHTRELTFTAPNAFDLIKNGAFVPFVHPLTSPVGRKPGMPALCLHFGASLCMVSSDEEQRNRRNTFYRL